MGPDAYLRYLQRSAYLSPERLEFCTVEPSRALARTQRMSGVWGDIIKKDLDLDQLRTIDSALPWGKLDPIAKSMFQKVLALLPSECMERLKNTAVGFLPIGFFNACCFGGWEAGYVITLNFALYYHLMLLNIALHAASATGELGAQALQSISPPKILRALIDAVKRPGPQSLEVIEKQYSFISPELMVLGFAGTGFALWFVLLHEIGHICGGDVDKGVAKAIFDPDRQKILYTRTNYIREYAADDFALRALVSDSSDAVGAWAAFSAVEAFFLFLHEAEKVRKRPSDTHPPAADRLRRLRKTLQRTWGPDIAGYSKANGIRFREYMSQLRS